MSEAQLSRRQVTQQNNTNSIRKALDLLRKGLPKNTRRVPLSDISNTIIALN